MYSRFSRFGYSLALFLDSKWALGDANITAQLPLCQTYCSEPSMGLGSSHLSLRYVLTVLVGAPSWSHRVALLVYSVAALNCLATTSDVTRVLNEVSLCVNFCLLSWFRSESGLIFLAKRWCCKILLRIWMPLLLIIFLKTLLFPQSRVLFSRFLSKRFSSIS